jgi:Ca2+/H+ antiporter, TMEM165/GDT1 family
MEDIMRFEKSNQKKFWIKRAIFIPIAIIAGIFIFGSIVMYLWNAIIPDVFGISAITFWQALGILALSKILFGGFHGGRSHHRCRGRGYGMKDKWMNLSPEEKEKMRKMWRGEFDPPKETE